MKKILSFCILSFLIISAAAQVPSTFHFQGAIKDIDGIPVNDTKFIEFRIYNAETDGIMLWNEGPVAVEIINGLFSMELGGINPFPEGLFDSSPLYMTFALASGEMEPRQKMLAVPFALKAASSDEDWQMAGNYIINLTDSVGIGTATPQTRFEVNAIMRLTPAGMTELCDLTLEGSIYYDMYLKEYCFCDGENWQQLDGEGYCECVDLDGDGADNCNADHPYDTDGLIADCDDGNDAIYPGSPEYCDGFDNDCDPGTVDGFGEPSFGNACDGVDSDLCEEGTIVCLAGNLACSDFTGDNEEICDGLDNDCDGEYDEDVTPVLNPNQNGVCNGSYMICIGGALVEDYSGIPNYEPNEITCDGLDNDCDGEYDEGCTACSGMPDGTLCDDGDLCTENDECQNGVCQGTPIICAPLDQCHDLGSCDQGNCVYPTSPNGTNCDDGDACTENDICSEGMCQGTPIDCDDSNPNTFDYCDSGSGCYHVPNNAPSASFTANPNPAITNQDISFNASASSDPDSGDYIDTYEWDWNDDGTFDQSLPSPTVLHQFGSPGFYDIILRVTDSQGLTDTFTLSVEVQ